MFLDNENKAPRAVLSRLEMARADDGALRTERMQIDLSLFDYGKVMERSHGIAEPDIAELDATYR